MTFIYRYKLLKVLAFDVDIYDKQFGLRLELLQCTSDSNCFRAHIWRTEFYRIQSTFLQNETTGQLAH